MEDITYTHHQFSTIYPEVIDILNDVLRHTTSILERNFLGMYLYGSLAAGGFDTFSDIDYIVVTRTKVRDKEFIGLQDMHTKISTMKFWCSDQLEGSYIPLAALKRFDPVHALYVHIDRGRGEKLQRMHIDDEKISRSWWGGWVLLRAGLLKSGITLSGPEPARFIEPVSPAEIQKSAILILNGWGLGILNDPTRISSRGYQSYIVLTLCRINYSFRNCSVASKPEAYRWTKENMDKQWHPLIDRAWSGRKHPGNEIEPEDNRLTMDFIRFTIEESQKYSIQEKV